MVGQFSVAGLSQNGQGDERAGQSCESYPAPCRPRLGRPTDRRTELIGHASGIKPQMQRNVYNECALLDRTREWRSPQLACVIN